MLQDEIFFKDIEAITKDFAVEGLQIDEKNINILKDFKEGNLSLDNIVSMFENNNETMMDIIYHSFFYIFLYMFFILF